MTCFEYHSRLRFSEVNKNKRFLKRHEAADAGAAMFSKTPPVVYRSVWPKIALSAKVSTIVTASTVVSFNTGEVILVNW